MAEKTGLDVLIEGLGVALIAIAKLRAESGIQVRCTESQDGTISGAEVNRLYQEAFRWVTDLLPEDNPLRGYVEQHRFTTRMPDTARFEVAERKPRR